MVGGGSDFTLLRSLAATTTHGAVCMILPSSNLTMDRALLDNAISGVGGFTFDRSSAMLRWSLYLTLSLLHTITT